MGGYEVILSSKEAIILFEWLAKYNSSDEKGDPAEEAVLFDLEAQLESLLVDPLKSDYAEILASAKLKQRTRNLNREIPGDAIS